LEPHLGALQQFSLHCCCCCCWLLLLRTGVVVVVAVVAVASSLRCRRIPKPSMQPRGWQYGLYFHKVGHVVLGRTPCMNVIDPTMPLIQAWVSQCILRHDAARSYMQLKDHQQVLCPMCMVWPFALPLNPGRRRSASRTWSGSFVGVGRFCGIHRKDGLQGILSTSPQQQAHCTSQHLNLNHHTESRCCPQLSERKQIPTISTRRTGRPQEGCGGKYNSVIVKIHRAPVYLGRGDHKILGPSR
jgi:hypothetical protein